VVVKAPPGHPNAKRDGYIFEHVLVMSLMIGRGLRPGESVHHKNCIRLPQSGHLPAATPLISGPVVRLPGRYGMVRRDGYRNPADQCDRGAFAAVGETDPSAGVSDSARAGARFGPDCSSLVESWASRHSMSHSGLTSLGENRRRAG
jgi:hypothetical protein